MHGHALRQQVAGHQFDGGRRENSDALKLPAIRQHLRKAQIVLLRDAEIDKVPDLSSESIRKVEKISVDTDQTVLLDVRNDKPLGEGKSKDATEMMLMDGAGKQPASAR